VLTYHNQKTTKNLTENLQKNLTFTIYIKNNGKHLMQLKTKKGQLVNWLFLF